MFFLELPFSVRHIYFRKEGEGGVIHSGLKKFTNPVLILRSLGPPWVVEYFIEWIWVEREELNDRWSIDPSYGVLWLTLIIHTVPPFPSIPRMALIPFDSLLSFFFKRLMMLMMPTAQRSQILERCFPCLHRQRTNSVDCRRSWERRMRCLRIGRT
jgi:hypothetical protein